MKIHIVTIGKPKLTYAQLGWSEYYARLERLHTIRTTRIPDKYAYDAGHIAATTQKTTRVVLEITGKEYSSESLAGFLAQRELDGKEISILIGGPEGLPEQIRQQADYLWSLGAMTLPHDLAMVVVLESLYRASTIHAGLPYHK